MGITLRARRNLSHYLAKARAEKALPYVKGRVLDIGCGYGALVPFLSKTTEYVGVDNDSNAIRMLLDDYPGKTVYCLDIQQDVVPEKEPFDTIVALATMEHLERAHDFLELYLPLLKVGGRIVLTTPTRFGDRVHRLLQLVHVASGVKEVHEHIFRLSELVSLTRECGCEVISAKRFQMGMNQILVGKKHREPAI